MRRGVLVGLLLGTLLFAGAVGAKVMTVTNPMSASLNANGYDITNASTMNAINFEADGYLRGHNLIAVNGAGANEANVSSCDDVYGCLFLQAGDGYGPGVRAGTADPTTTCPIMAAGSVYLRHVDPTHGEEWVLTTSPCGWAKVAS